MTRTFFRSAVCAGVVSLAMAVNWHPVQAQDAAKTTWDGLYSVPQALRGEALYKAQCSKCHGDSAMGGDAPSLADSGFAGNWDGLNLAQLLDRIRISMPLDAPQSLTRPEGIDLVAYLLRQNRFPAGEAELPDRADLLGALTYVATKP